MTRMDDLLRERVADDFMHQMIEAVAQHQARGRAVVTVSIVCEGACNPHLADYTDQSRRFSSSGRVAPVPDVTLLTHTPHVQVAGEYYRCTVCGTRRKF